MSQHHIDHASTATGNPPYTQEEKAWLKKHFDGEFKFLRDYGLSIYEDEDREEGRRIARGCMESEVMESQVNDGSERSLTTTSKEEDDEPEEEEEENKFLRDLEEHPESHAADYHFSENELEWIEKHYDYSSNFLMAYGLKFYDDEDCREGKAILQQLMQDG